MFIKYKLPFQRSKIFPSMFKNQSIGFCSYEFVTAQNKLNNKSHNIPINKDLHFKFKESLSEWLEPVYTPK